MSKFDTKANKAICVLPWVHEYRNMYGEIAPCCSGDELQANESMDTLRQQMLDGIKPRPCNDCYIKEKDSNWSPRILETRDWISKFGEPDIEKPSLQFADIRFDPTCNLKCKTCGPRDSTLWQKELGVKVAINQDNKNYFSSLDKRILKKVYLAGGEPTYIRNYFEFLKSLYEINSDCEVVINTNLKRLSDEWKEIIAMFKNLTIICSCDAIGTLGTYVRYPLHWQEFEKNVDWVSKNANFLQFNLVASNLTSHKLHETCSWMKQYSKNINVSILHQPKHFSEKAVPISYRTMYIENITKLSKFPVSIDLAVNFRTKIQYLIKKYTESPYDISLHQKLKDEIKRQDGRRGQILKDIDPFLHSWIDA